MPAARYWRITAIETYRGIGLELSEVALHTSAGRVDGSATLTSVIAPTTGALASLGDAAFTPTVTWAESAASLPGFALVYDFGTDTDIVKVGVAGPSQEKFTHKFAVDYSADGAAWTRLLRPAVAAKWPGSAAFYELDAAQANDAFTGLAVAVAPGSTGAIVYQRSGNTFTNANAALSLNGPKGATATFSPDAKTLVVGTDTSPFLRAYARQGLRFDYDPISEQPAGDVNYTAISSDGVYLAAAHAAYPYLSIYKRTSGVFSKLPNPSTLPSGTGYGCAFSPDGVYLAVAHWNSPGLRIYKRSGDTFTNLTISFFIPGAQPFACTFSPDGTYLVVTHLASPYITIYKRDGDTFSNLPNPASLPPGDARDCSFSPDGTYLAVASTTSPYLSIYKRSGDTFTQLANPSTMPTNIGYGCAFSPDGVYLAVAHEASPFITIYERSGDTFTKLTNPASLPTTAGYKVAWLPFAETGAGMLPANYDATPIRPFDGDTITIGDGNIGDTQMTPLMPVPTFDMEDAGAFRIVGTVKEKSSPTDKPVARKVQLFNQRSGRLIREDWSDPVTGSYQFENIKNDIYFVVSFDYNGLYRAVIADNLAPELMP